MIKLFYHLSLDALRRIYIRLNGRSLSSDGQIRANLDFDKFYHNPTQDKIRDLILSGQPLFIGRLGSIEMDCLNNYLQITGKIVSAEPFSIQKFIQDKCYANWMNFDSIRGMSSNAGFFPSNEANLIRYGGGILNDIDELDVFLSWQYREKYIPLPNAIDKIITQNVSYPFLYTNPWTSALSGKRVLVISPFSETIKSQYRKRKFIFNNSQCLPDFELYTLQSYNVLRGKNNSDAKDWFDALEKMKFQISQIDFDIAIIGCGAFAFPLGAHCKRIGKQAITTCGATQLLFGIYGQRWGKWLEDNGILNEYWVHPGLDERPIGFEKVENGAYW